MKRHPALREYSRDHHFLLIQAREIEWAATQSEHASSWDDVITGFLDSWEREIAPHLYEEETVLWPLLLPHATQLLAELEETHHWLRTAVSEIAAQVERGESPRGLLEKVGRRLHDHVRREERELFEGLQAALSEKELRRIGDAARQFRRAHRPDAIERGRDY